METMYLVHLVHRQGLGLMVELLGLVQVEVGILEVEELMVMVKLEIMYLRRLVHLLELVPMVVWMALVQEVEEILEVLALKAVEELEVMCLVELEYLELLGQDFVLLDLQDLRFGFLDIVED